MPLTAWRNRITVFALTLVTVAGVWAFTGGPWGASPASRTSPASPAELSRHLPFYGLLYARTDAVVRIAEAQRQLVIDCMARQGFRYAPASLAAAGASEDHPEPFGLESLVPPTSATPTSEPAEKPMSEAFAVALLGNPDQRISAAGKTVRVSRPANGCQAESEKRLLGDGRQQWLRLRVQLGDGEKEAQLQLEKDPAFRAANSSWRQCMYGAGFTSETDPVALMNSLPLGTDLTLSAAAQADVRCKADTDYLSTAYSRLDAMQTAWLHDHASVLTGWNSLEHRQDTAASTVLGAR